MATKTEANLIEALWGIIANAGGGNWKLETKPWQKAAAKARDRYHKWMDKHLKARAEGQ